MMGTSRVFSLKSVEFNQFLSVKNMVLTWLTAFLIPTLSLSVTPGDGELVSDAAAADGVSPRALPGTE